MKEERMNQKVKGKRGKAEIDMMREEESERKTDKKRIVRE